MRILKEMLNTLKSIDGTLKRIEQSVSEKKQHDVIKDWRKVRTYSERFLTAKSYAAFKYRTSSDDISVFPQSGASRLSI